MSKVSDILPKVLEHFFISQGRFPIHTDPTLPHPCWTRVSTTLNFYRLSTLDRVKGGGGEGELQEDFEKDGTVLRGNREMTGKYEYCSTVPRTFVQDSRKI